MSQRDQGKSGGYKNCCGQTSAKCGTLYRVENVHHAQEEKYKIVQKALEK